MNLKHRRRFMMLGAGIQLRNRQNKNRRSGKQSSQNMSLYHEAADVLIRASKSTDSLSSLVYSDKKLKLKSKPAQVYALVVEASKWSPVISKIVEQAGLLKLERKVGAPCPKAIMIHEKTNGGNNSLVHNSPSSLFMTCYCRNKALLCRKIMG